MLVRIYFILLLWCSSHLQAMQMEKPCVFSFPDSFFPLESPDPKLSELLSNLYLEIDKVRGDNQALMMMLKTENKASAITHLSSYLANHKHMKEMRQNIELETITFCYQQWRTPQEEDFQIFTLNILEAIINSRYSIRFIRPVLSRFEKYIWATTDHEIIEKNALYFFFFNIINKILVPLFEEYPCAVESSKIMMKMISKTNFTSSHKAFFKQESAFGKQAFQRLDYLSKTLVSEPQIDNYILYLLNQYISTLDKKAQNNARRERIVAHWFKKNSTPMRGSHRAIAQIALSKLEQIENGFALNFKQSR